MGFVSFMSSAAGRWLRIVAGLALVGAGVYLAANGTPLAGVILAVVGLVPLLAGVFDVCVFAPLFRAPFVGREARARARAR